MTNSIFILFGIGMLVNIILSLIYAPLGIIVTLMINIYAILSSIHAFKESLDTVDVNQLVLVSTGVIIATVTIVTILLMILCDISFKDLSSVTSLMSSLSSSSSDVSSLLDFQTKNQKISSLSFCWIFFVDISLEIIYNTKGGRLWNKEQKQTK